VTNVVGPIHSQHPTNTVNLSAFSARIRLVPTTLLSFSRNLPERSDHHLEVF